MTVFDHLYNFMELQKSVTVLVEAVETFVDYLFDFFLSETAASLHGSGNVFFAFFTVLSDFQMV